MVPHVNREAVESRLARLETEYDIGYHEEEAVIVEPEAFEKERVQARNGYIGSSYVWVVRSPEQAKSLTESMPADCKEDGDRVLLILGRGDNAWGIPGGGREGGETFEEGAYRELREETDITCEITGCFGTRYERRQSPSHDEILHTLRVVFEGRYTGGTIAIQPGELNGAAWTAKRPQRIHPLAKPLAEKWFDNTA